MRTQRITVAFPKMTDMNLKRKAQSIVLAMTNNTHFPNPTPSLAELSETINRYSGSLVAALEGGRVLKSEKNKIRKQLEDQLSRLGAYVTLTAHIDEPMLVSSGFDLIKSTETSSFLSAPENIKAQSGVNSGELMLIVNGVKRVRAYSHEYTQDPATTNSVWTSELDTVCKYLFTGLEPGKKYWFRVAAVGVRGRKNYSHHISCYVQ